jgi:hypothetical protein
LGDALGGRFGDAFAFNFFLSFVFSSCDTLISALARKHAQKRQIVTFEEDYLWRTCGESLGDALGRRFGDAFAFNFFFSVRVTA